MSSTASVPSLATAEASRSAISRQGWVWIVLVGGLFALFHQHFLHRTWIFATTDNNWSHALIVPLISGYFIYQQRHRLFAIERKVAITGLPIMLLGMVGYAFWIFPGRNDMFQGYSMILALCGLVIFLMGWRVMTVLWLPILYLGFAVKVADRLWEWVAFQLQHIAAIGATYALKLFTAFIDFDVTYRGSTIDLQLWDGGRWTTEALNVAEACSGLRMLMAFLALGVALAFIWDRAWWQRLIMIAMAVPIAVLVNIGRVTVLGLLYLVDPELAQGDFHLFVGMLMLIPAALLFLGLGWVLENLFVREPAPAAAAPATTAAATSAAATAASASNAAAAPGKVGEGAHEAGSAAKPSLKTVWIIGSVVAAGLGALAGVAVWYLAEAGGAGGMLGCAGVGALVGPAVFSGLMWLVVVIERGTSRRTNEGGAGSRGRGPGALVAAGAGLGATVMVLLMLSYGLLLVAARPDVAPFELSNALVSVLLVLSVGGMLAVMLGLPWLVPGRGRQQRQLALLAVAVGVIAAAIVGQRTTIAMTEAVLIKEPVPLRHKLMMLPERLEGWELFREDPPLSREMIEELGTDEYLSRIYQDRSWPENQPGGYVRLHMTYYTGKADTVPHVPDRCFVGAGMEFVGRGRQTLELTSPYLEPDPESENYLHHATLESVVRIPDKRINATRFTFARPEVPGSRENVFYFFVANGRFMSTPEEVRVDGFNLRDRYAYYAKVELQVLGVDDVDLAAERAQSLLDAVLPEVMAMLPDWVEVQRGLWPEPAAQQ